MKDDIRFIVRDKRISIQRWMSGAYDYEEGYYEIAYIKLSESKASFMDDVDLDEVKGMLNNILK